MPWYRRARNVWFVTLDQVQHVLGPDMREAFERFYRLMHQPQQRQVSTQLVVAIVDAFVDRVQPRTRKRASPRRKGSCPVAVNGGVTRVNTGRPH